jgi:5-methylcytosine-specific restriction endonuclease McrA
MDKYKTCTKCKANKSFTDYAKNPQNKTTGLQSQCKQCRNDLYKIYASKNVDKLIARRAAYNSKNRLEILAKRKAKYQENKSVFRQHNSDWEKQNRIITRERTRRRRFRLKEIVSYQITIKEFEKLYSNPCFYCGSEEQTSIDHVIPISRGGTHGIGNLVSCCKSCNSSKCNKTIMEWKINNEKVSNTMRRLSSTN